MSMRRDSIAAIFLLIVFAAYGQQALQIDMFPGQELEPFKPRTMPVSIFHWISVREVPARLAVMYQQMPAATR